MGLLGNPQQPQRYSLLSPDAVSGMQMARNLPPPAPAAAPPRQGVNGFRVALRTLLGGEDPFTATDNERARLEQEAMRPQMQARQAQLRSAAEAMGPAAMIAFETNPAKFGESLAEQYSPQVIAAGGIQSVIGNGQRVGAPQTREFGDRLAITDPVSQQTTYSDARPETFAEQTGRINANNPINIAPGGRAVDPRTGQVIAEGAPRVFSAADATQLYNEDGSLMAENRRDAPQVDPANAAKASASTTANLAMISNTRAAITRARGQVGAFSTGVLSSRLPFNQSRANLDATVDTIKGNLSFTELAKMRENSPTGGALGAIAVRELDLLGSTVASLSLDQSQEEVERSLDTIDQSMARYEAALRQAQQAPAQGGGAPARSSSGPVAEDAQGNRYVVRNGQWVRE